MLTRTQEKLEAAIERFDRAITLDPGFAEAGTKPQPIIF